MLGGFTDQWARNALLGQLSNIQGQTGTAYIGQGFGYYPTMYQGTPRDIHDYPERYNKSIEGFKAKIKYGFDRFYDCDF